MNMQGLRNAVATLAQKNTELKKARLAQLSPALRLKLKLKAAGESAGRGLDRALLSPILLTGGLAGMGASKATKSSVVGGARTLGNFARKHPVISAVGGAAALDLPIVPGVVSARDALSFAAYPVTAPLGELKALANPQLTPAMQKALATQPNISEGGPFSGTDRYSWGVRRPTMVAEAENAAGPVVKESAMQLPRISEILQKTTAPAGPPPGVGEQLMGKLKSLPALAVGGAAALGGGLLKKEIESAIRRRRQPGMLGEVFGTGGAFRKALGYGLGAGVLGGGAVAASKTYEKVTDPYKKEQAFKGMVSMSPGLKNEDSKAVRDSFNVLWKFNKDVAEEPTSAASFVRRLVMFKDEGVQTNDIKTLAEIRKNMADSGKSRGGMLPSSAMELASLGPRSE